MSRHLPLVPGGQPPKVDQIGTDECQVAERFIEIRASLGKPVPRLVDSQHKVIREFLSKMHRTLTNAATRIQNQGFLLVASQRFCSLKCL